MGVGVDAFTHHLMAALRAVPTMRVVEGESDDRLLILPDARKSASSLGKPTWDAVDNCHKCRSRAGMRDDLMIPRTGLRRAVAHQPSSPLLRPRWAFTHRGSRFPLVATRLTALRPRHQFIAR